MLLSGIAETANALIMARIILGAGGAFIFPVANSSFANWFPVADRELWGGNNLSYYGLNHCRRAYPFPLKEGC